MTQPLVEVSGLRKVFRSPGPWGLGRRETVVLDGIDFRLEEGEFAALVGESGSGKTTLGRCLLGILPFDAGTVRIAGFDVARLGRRNRRAFCRTAQMVFQNPYASLNPALRVRAALAEVLRVHRDLARGEVARQVERMARSVRLPAERLDEFPNRLSGGERRRVGFARALATLPRFVVADEPVSGLDPPIQLQLLDLLARIHARGGITWVCISHDLRVVRTLATRVLVLYRGRLVEDAPADRFFGGGARHPYSRELLLSAFSAETYARQRGSATREPPGPEGCPFRHRCPRAGIARESPCATMPPPTTRLEANHTVACHRWQDV